MESYNIKSASKTFLWAMFLPQILAFAIILVLSLFYKNVEDLQNSWIYIFACVIVAQVAFALIYFRFAKKNQFSIKQKLVSKTKQLSLKNVVFCILISVIAIVSLFYFVGLFDILFGHLGYVPEEPALPNNTILWLLVNIVLSAVLPAILEELIFRNIIFKGLKSKGFWFACIISSLMFMLVHLSLGSVVYPILMGIVFCLIVRRTGNVLYSCIVHFCNNTIALIIQYIQNITGKTISVTAINLWWEVLLVILIAIIGYVGIMFIIKYCLKGKEEPKIELESIKEESFIQAANDGEENAKKAVVVGKATGEKAMAIYSLLIGFAFWIIMIIS